MQPTIDETSRREPTLTADVIDPVHRQFRALALERSDADEGFLTPAIDDGQPFDEALPSWNVSAASGAFTVDIRVAAGVDSPWTPWLRIGDWGIAERADDVATACAEGEVAVDVLKLERPMRRAQLRLQFRDPGFEASSARVAVTLTSGPALSAHMNGAPDEAWPTTRIQLDVPRRAQRADGGAVGHRICSPTSVAMVAAFHGADQPTLAFADSILDPHFDIYGNWNRAVQAASIAGVPGELARLSSWAVVARHLERGRPLVCSIRAAEGELNGAPYPSTKGHLLVLTGLGAHGAVFVNDPAAPTIATVSRTYSRADLETVWFGTGGVAYVFEPTLTRAAPAQ